MAGGPGEQILIHTTGKDLLVGTHGTLGTPKLVRELIQPRTWATWRIGYASCIEREINSMPQSSHDQAAELHNLASHAHAVAAVAHGKADHQSAHELSKQADEHSRNALKHSEQLEEAAAESAKAEAGDGEKVKAVHTVRPGLPG